METTTSDLSGFVRSGDYILYRNNPVRRVKGVARSYHGELFFVPEDTGYFRPTISKETLKHRINKDYDIMAIFKEDPTHNPNAKPKWSRSPEDK